MPVVRPAALQGSDSLASSRGLKRSEGTKQSCLGRPRSVSVFDLPFELSLFIFIHIVASRI